MKQLGVNELGPHCKWKAQPRRLFDAKPFITWSNDYFVNWKFEDTLRWNFNK